MLQKRPINKNDYGAWEVLTRDYLVKSFGSESPNVDSVMDVGKYGSFPMNASEGWWERHRFESLQRQVVVLDSLLELLNTEIELATEHAPVQDGTTPGNSVFLVHGHSESVLQAVARFLEKLELKVTILREQPNEGRTIIEKFIDYSDVGFAVVLLTGDDRGGTKLEPYDNQRSRARQNVILELGFFIGKLGRKRACALYEPGVEIPSDYQGVLFIAIDESGAWKLALARELRAAGFEIDMNRAL